MLIDLEGLMHAWRKEAERLRSRYASEGLALMCEAHADELARALTRYANEELTLAEAADESGYSQGHLGRQVRDGTIPNAGQPYAPRIRRGDLPLKKGLLPSDESVIQLESRREQVARAVVDQQREANHG